MKEQRSDKIMELLRQNDFYMSVEQLSDRLGISKSTVRRNLQALEKIGKIQRKYGGAEIVDSSKNLTPFTLRKNANPNLKMIMARLATTLIKQGSVIFLDASSTANILTSRLMEFENITIVTNGINNVYDLSESTLTVYSTGGKLSPTTRVAYVGAKAVEFINSMRADICFISALGMDENGTLYDMYDDEIAVRRAMINNSNQKVMMLDSTKLNKVAPFKLGQIEEFDYLISDKNLSKFIKNKTSCKFMYDV